jgi:hypothetical protein
MRERQQRHDGAPIERSGFSAGAWRTRTKDLGALKRILEANR